MQRQEEALEVGGKFLQLFEKQNAKSSDIVYLYYMMGSGYLERKEIDKAEDALRKCFAMMESLRFDPADMRDMYNTIGTLYQHDVKNLEKALYYHEKELEQALKIDYSKEMKNSLFDCYDRVGFIYDEIGKYEKALDIYERSMEIRKEMFEETENGYAVGLGNLGTVYLHLGRVDEALQSLETCYGIQKNSEQEGQADVMIEHVKEMLKCYELKGGEEKYGREMRELMEELKRWEEQNERDKARWKEVEEGEDWEDDEM
eukprot:TRINITY_DN5771_c0_g1_i10.p3 TRINITY_DN5771_c0_g1~~TRINITY_DN5771_c0_g1_i10.p3  ORF type:complete len:259 (-),score=65.31 TRINITY_DN5771_c0_g1_i10:71-847(-)